ncbi:hypothetical protein CANARDRAFT_29757 [[Candida] arabinofermentans NRRL YB-2248]|uniref:Uncharacterized protein n=1 Tax=[Candida] arabinofermentans NRRL YB-2248 TaxID=983967 RepID=A0A1E4SWG1_9ASCO|nr:hypothetical protein CANARDRAFT_29757 [[Candida] arabinofermentans NRRL YB-2248]
MHYNHALKLFEKRFNAGVSEVFNGICSTTIWNTIMRLFHQFETKESQLQSQMLY